MFGKEKTIKQPDPLSRYVDPTGELPNSELKQAEWYLKHKFLLQKIGRWALIVFCVITVGYSSIAWGDYLIFGYFEDRQQLAEQSVSFPNFAVTQTAYQATPLVLSNTEIFETNPGKFDFVTSVKNDNSRFVATVVSHYLYDGGVTTAQTDILLPGEERPIAAFGQVLSGFPTGARLVVEKTDWQRVSAHDVGDMATYVGSRLNFPIENFSFVRAQGGADNAPAHQISFDIKNDSAYSYWQPVFFVDLLDGGTRTGIVYIELKEFQAGETRRVEIGSLAGDINATDIAVHPVINIFASAVYMAPGM